MLRLLAQPRFTYIYLRDPKTPDFRPKIGRELPKLGGAQKGAGADLALSTSRALGKPEPLERPRYGRFMGCFHAFPRLTLAR